MTKENIKIEDMMEAGLHFGQKTSRVHPKMKPYISTVRNSVHIINLEKTLESLREALEFIKTSLEEGKVMLLVGTKVQAKESIKETAEECGLPYVNDRWLGGTFTNFKTIQKNIERLKDLEKKKQTGEFNKYTKKEKAKIDKEIKDLEVKIGGIKNLDKIPDIIFVVDAIKDALAIKEAKSKGVKVIAIVDTNVDPTIVDYPIPANDDAVTSIKYILDRVKEVASK
jgi:small subunit ribosomal protein S2